MAQRRATRAEIAAATGLSKPTVSESVRRLSAAGAVVDTGERTTGRGRVGTYYALPADAAARWWRASRPRGSSPRRSTSTARSSPRAQAPVTAPGAGAGRPGAAARRRRGRRRPVPARRRQRRRSRGPRDRAARRAARTRRSCSARSTRRPCSPSWSTVRSPSTTTSTGRPAPSTATRRATSSTSSSARASAARSSATARSGAATPGVAGEIAHVLTAGPGGAAMRLTDVFAALGLRRPGSTAIDVPALLRDAERAEATAGPRGGRRALGRGGAGRPGRRAARRAVGPHPRVLAPWRASSRRAPRHVPVEAATEPALTAARESALQRLRDAVVSGATQG